MSKKLTFPVSYILLLSLILTSITNAANVVPQVYVSFDGSLVGTNYALSLRELDNTGTFAAHNGTERVSGGLGILMNSGQTGQESFQFNASSFNKNGSDFTGTAFVVEAVFTAGVGSAYMAPVIDIGGQCFIRFFNDELSAGCWDGSNEVVNNGIQPIPEVGHTSHYAIVYDGRNTIDYYLDGVRIFQSDNGSPQQITSLISWGNIRHTSVDGGRQLIGQYDSVSFSTFTGEFNPDTDFILPDGPVLLELASNPSPADEDTDVLRDTDLDWTPGVFAASHNVYLGMVFEDIDNADETSPLLVGPGENSNTYDPDSLEFDQTYFWRIDEVNAPPDSTIFKGKVWSFTTESLAYQIPSGKITATASSNIAGQGPERTIDGSGLVDGFHSVDLPDMWLSGMDDTGPVWIQYEFDKIYMLHEMSVWNFNGQSVLVLYGIKDVTVEYSIDGENWTQVDDVTEFSQATGQADYASNSVVAFGGAPARYIRINPATSWGGESYNLFGLSEVRFTKIPVDARGPDPADGSTGAAIDSILGWKMGREALGHNVYFSDNRQAVADGTAFVTSVDKSVYGPLSLDLNTSYYWRVDEVNDAGTIPIWQGDIWSFMTQDYLVVDDFESYNDIPAGQTGSRLVYDIWLDGIADPTKGGSQTGYFEGVSLETDIFHSGRKSVPILYDNTSANLSEVTANTSNLAVGRNWTIGNPDKLVFSFYGDPNNSTTEQMYVKVDGSKVVYIGNLIQAEWREFSVDLDSLGIDLSNVTSLTIGFEKTGVIGGSGMVLVDDIRLYATSDGQAVITSRKN